MISPDGVLITVAEVVILAAVTSLEAQDWREAVQLTRKSWATGTNIIRMKYELEELSEWRATLAQEDDVSSDTEDWDAMN